MRDLTELRTEIDRIDKQLTALFEERMDTVLEIAEYKTQHNLPILNTGREQEVIESCIECLHNRAYEKQLAQWMQQTMTLSKEIQKEYIASLQAEES